MRRINRTGNHNYDVVPETAEEFVSMEIEIVNSRMISVKSVIDEETFELQQLQARWDCLMQITKKMQVTGYGNTETITIRRYTKIADLKTGYRFRWSETHTNDFVFLALFEGKIIYLNHDYQTVTYYLSDEKEVYLVDIC